MTFLPLLFSAGSGAAPRLSPPCLTPALCGQSSQEPCCAARQSGARLPELLMKTHADLKGITQRQRHSPCLSGHKASSPPALLPRATARWELEFLFDWKTSQMITFWSPSLGSDCTDYDDERNAYKWSYTWEGKSTTDWKHDKVVAECTVKKNQEAFLIPLMKNISLGFCFFKFPLSYVSFTFLSQLFPLKTPEHFLYVQLLLLLSHFSRVWLCATP